jgi:hypothetical protein
MNRRTAVLMLASGLAMAASAIFKADSSRTERVYFGCIGGLLFVLSLAELVIPSTLVAWEKRATRRGIVRWVARVRRLGGVGSIPASEREALLEIARVFCHAGPEGIGRTLADTPFEWPVLHRMFRYDLAPSLWYFALTEDEDSGGWNRGWLLRAVVLNRNGLLRRLPPLRWALTLLATLPVASEWRQMRREFHRERGLDANARRAALPPEDRPGPGG